MWMHSGLWDAIDPARLNLICHNGQLSVYTLSIVLCGDTKWETFFKERAITTRLGHDNSSTKTHFLWNFIVTVCIIETATKICNCPFRTAHYIKLYIANIHYKSEVFKVAWTQDKCESRGNKSEFPCRTAMDQQRNWMWIKLNPKRRINN